LPQKEREKEKEKEKKRRKGKTKNEKRDKPKTGQTCPKINFSFFTNIISHQEDKTMTSYLYQKMTSY